MLFTSTYNRANYLLQVYHFLKKQTYKNFEWIIVNDGSADDTNFVVQGFIKEGVISIKYIN
ncbi:glycosyltransferase family A protein [Caproicibacterium sp. NSD3]